MNKKKFFIVSDVHSFYNEMIAALDEAGYDRDNPNHIFVSCGDLFDRGPDAKKCIDFVLDLPEDRRILIRGNHEDLLDEIIEEGGYRWCDYSNGTVDTVNQFFGGNDPNADDEIKILAIGQNVKWRKYRSLLVDCYETQNYIFTHAWVPDSMIPIVQEAMKECEDVYYPYELSESRARDWYMARWLNPMKQAFDGRIIYDKTIVAGHWHTSYGHCMQKAKELRAQGNKDFHSYITKSAEWAPDADFSIFRTNGLIAVDGCVAHSGKVNCLVVENFIL